MHPELAILVNLSVSLSAALVLGFITQRLRLSPILGYLAAGIMIGPQTPGFVADQTSAAQFAEIGVILLMFGVGMHFDLRDLLAVRRVAVPGAVGQILAATLLAMGATVAFGGSWGTGAIMGVAVSVASTVVLVRGLTDNGVLQTTQGHIAIGWLIVEDLFTVFLLVMLPAIAAAFQGGGAGAIGIAFAAAVLKIAVLGVVVLWAGRKVIPWILTQVARTRARELFTLTILALALTIAMGSSLVLGVSVALGAFLAGMVVGQSEVSHQAAADALPMRDAFAVLFFVSVGMLFDPSAIADHPALFLALLAVILIAKPLAAIAIVWSLRYSFRTALTVAIGLAQIGEFSFILADLASEHELMSVEGQSLLVACAIVSIAVNPLLFRAIVPLEAWLRRQPRAWRLLNGRSEARARAPIPKVEPAEGDDQGQSRAIIIGYGPVGKTASSILKGFGFKPVIVDLNVDTVADLSAAGESAVYGDAAQREILEAAGISTAKYLLITVPELETRTVVVIVARELNPDLRIFVRARYLEERAWLEEIGATEVCFEEAETAIGLASLILREVGAGEDRVRMELGRIRARLAFQERAEPTGDSRPTPDDE
jgi:CPA2 family monovalent cation:H+ antiporter-2